MTVPTVPTVPTSNSLGGNGQKPQISARFRLSVPTVPTFFYMKEEKEKGGAYTPAQCILRLKNSALGRNGRNKHKKWQISERFKRSHLIRIGRNKVGKVGTP